jgi:hypothetical protein
MGLISHEDLPFIDRMKIKGGLPELLTITDIALAWYPEENQWRFTELLINKLVELCKKGEIQYQGDKNARMEYVGGGLYKSINEPTQWRIHRDELKKYLQSVGEYLPDDSGYLMNWFADITNSQANDAIAGKPNISLGMVEAITSTVIAKTVSNVEIAINNPTKKNGFEHPKTKVWKSAARAIGQEWMERERRNGNDPGVIEIAKYVEGELSNRKITGARGRFLDFETIKRDALKGITGKPPNGRSTKA